MPVDPIERLAANARRRSEQTLQKAQDAITVMAARGDAITVARLAKNARSHARGSIRSPSYANGSSNCARRRQRGHPVPPQPAGRASTRSSTACTWPTSASVNYETRTSSYGERSSSCTGNSGTAGRHETARQRQLSTQRCPGDTAHRQRKVEITAAVVDRLTFGGNIIKTGTDSYRLRTTRTSREEPPHDPPDTGPPHRPGSLTGNRGWGQFKLGGFQRSSQRCGCWWVLKW